MDYQMGTDVLKSVMIIKTTIRLSGELKKYTSRQGVKKAFFRFFEHKV